MKVLMASLNASCSIPYLIQISKRQWSLLWMIF